MLTGQGQGQSGPSFPSRPGPSPLPGALRLWGPPRCQPWASAPSGSQRLREAGLAAAAEGLAEPQDGHTPAGGSPPPPGSLPGIREIMEDGGRSPPGSDSPTSAGTGVLTGKATPPPPPPHPRCLPAPGARQWSPCLGAPLLLGLAGCLDYSPSLLCHFWGQILKSLPPGEVAAQISGETTPSVTGSAERGR